MIDRILVGWVAVTVTLIESVPTAVTGFYGQNVPYPGFGKVEGFWTSTVVMVGISVCLYVIFRRRDWL